MDLKQEVSILHSRNTTQLRSDRAKEELLERLIRDPLLSADPLLRHALADQGRQGAVTHKSWAARVELLDALIAQEAGEAFNIYVLRHDGERIRAHHPQHSNSFLICVLIRGFVLLSSLCSQHWWYPTQRRWTK
jgi:tRNA pseudouridine-54 N-methylase